MKLSFEFGIDDWANFQRYHYVVSPAYRKARNYGRSLGPIAALLFIAARYLKHGFDPVHLGLFGAFGLLWFAIYPRWMERTIAKRSQQLRREDKTGSMFGHREVELLPDRICVASSTAETIYRAAAVEKIVENPEALMLYVSPVQAVILPRRKLSEDDFEQAAAFAREHYGNRA